MAPPGMTGGIRRPKIGGGPIGGQRPMGQGGPRVQRRGGGGPPGPPGKRGGVAPPQMAMQNPAQAGPPMNDLGQFGALGAVPGVGQQGAVNPSSLMNVKRRGGGFA